MAKLNTKKQSSTKRVIVYGASFSGKTKLVGLLAEHFNLLWIDLEAGHGTLYQLPESYQERIEIVAVPDTRSYPMGIETMLKVVKGPVDICEAHGKCGCMACKKAEAEAEKNLTGTEVGVNLFPDYFVHVDVNSMDKNTILVVDSLTQLSNSAISNITKGQPDDYKLDYDDWGNLGKLLDIVLSHVQQASYNVVFISHVNETTRADKKVSLTPTGGTRAFSSNITKYFTDVVYLERKNKKHTCISTTTASTNIIAGSQTGVALELLGEPSLLPLFKPELAPPELASTLAKKPASLTKTGGESAADVLARLKSKK